MPLLTAPTRRSMTHFRAIVDGVSFFTTKREIVGRGVGDQLSVNLALIEAYHALKLLRLDAKIKPSGLKGCWEGHAVQLDMWNHQN